MPPRTTLPHRRRLTASAAGSNSATHILKEFTMANEETIEALLVQMGAALDGGD
jgi:hypothetical protein